MIIFRKQHAVIRNVCGLAVILASTSAAVAPPAAATEPPQMLRWEIAATIITKEDSLGIFPDVRLGDPVRGTLTYDAARELSYPVENFDGSVGFGYEHPRWIEAVSMIIENPRTGGETRFMKDLAGDWADIQVGNSEIEDGFLAAQSVISPSPLFTGETPLVMVGMYKPHVNGFDWSPPVQLNLEDWPWAKMVFTDLYFGDEGGARLEAEIYSLTAVAVPRLAGDFNYDGVVDSPDYYGWHASFGSMDDLYADGNGNGIVDAADYVVWRDNLGANSGMALSTSVPESNALILAAMALAILAGRPVAKCAADHRYAKGAQ